MFYSAKFTTAITAEVVTCPVKSKLVITGVEILLDGGASVNVATNLGFGANTLTRVFTGHPGIVPGSGFVNQRRGDGNKAENIYFTTGVPTGGSVQLNLDYEIHAAN